MAARRHRFSSHPPLEISGTIGPEDGEPLTLVVLGDSSVAGVGADAAEDTLTYGVAKALSDQYRVSLHALGVSGLGWVTAGRQLPRLDGLEADIVLVCVGTNDVTHGTTLCEARRQLRLLVEGLALVAPDAKVIVSGLPLAETSTAFHRPLRDLIGFALLFTRLYRAGPHGISVFDIAKLTKSAFHGKGDVQRQQFHPPAWATPSSAPSTVKVKEALEAAPATSRATPEAELAG